MFMYDLRSCIAEYYCRKLKNYDDYETLKVNLFCMSDDEIYSIVFALYGRRKLYFFKDYFERCMSCAIQHVGLKDNDDGFKMRNEMCFGVGDYILKHLDNLFTSGVMVL